MRKTKVLYIVSDIDKAFAFEWIAKGLDKSRFELSFLLLNQKESRLQEFLESQGIPVARISVNSFFRLFFQVLIFLLKNRPDVVHCHLRRAELSGIPAAFVAGIRKRIYTRHSSTYNHLYHKKGVIADKTTAALSTDIVAISENVADVLIGLEGVNPSKVKRIHHGFDLSLFEKVTANEIDLLKAKYALPAKGKIIGMISRFFWWKGFEYAVPAIADLMREFPDVHLVIANAHGSDAEGIRKMIRENIPEGRVTEIKFEENIPALYKCFEVFVHVPFDRSVEAFGQIYVEALAAEIPSVFTLSGVAPEFIKDNYNALVVPFRDCDSIKKACTQLLQDNELRERLVANGRKSLGNFELPFYIRKLEELYQ